MLGILWRIRAALFRDERTASLRIQVRRSLGASLALFFLLCLNQVCYAAARGTECFTAWDDYYFYAAFQVNDPHVNSVNNTPMSQPQEDCDVEVFFDTKGPQASAARTPGTYQMAVSAGNGAYFSEGDAGGKAKAKVVFTYKYAATVDGTLNDNSDTDVGFTVELAIPWQELGLTGPPHAGTVWGFNVINRDRESVDKPADHLASLALGVKGADDVQNPKLWTGITFTDSLISQNSDAKMVYCPHVQGHYPIIDGVVRSGEYFQGDGFELGPPIIAAAAPTKDQEPNIQLSEDEMFQQALAQTPPPMVVNPGQNNQPPAETPPAPTPAPTTSTPPAETEPQTNPEAVQKGYDVELPGGGTIHVGKLQPPPVYLTPTPQVTPMPASPPTGKHKGGAQYAQGPGSEYGPQFPASGPNLDTAQALRLLDQTTVTKLFLAIYHPNFDPDTQFLDQPVSSRGFWFGSSVQYQLDQLKDARRAGVDVLLVVYDPSDPTSTSGVETLVQAEQELRGKGNDYPLLAPDLVKSGDDAYAGIKSFFERVPPEFRGQVYLPDSDDNRAEYIAVVPDPVDVEALRKQFATDFAPDTTGLFVAQAGNAGPTSADPDIPLTSAMVTPAADPTAAVSARNQGQAYESSWTSATSANADWTVLDSWNDYARGTEVAATREFGEHYADITKLEALNWNGGQEWHARYLKCDMPAVINADTIYTVQVRIENAGTLPWRLGEDYGLSYRWYKDGRLYDDSAPKLPINTDIYPGQSRTVSVGILAHNQYATPIEPGDYTLVFDMVQANDRWFTLAGDAGLKVHVHIAAAGDDIAARATFIDSTLPTRIQAGAVYKATITVRNDSGATWAAGKTSIVYAADPADTDAGGPASGAAVLTADIDAGAIGHVVVPVTIGSAGSSGRYLVKWTVHSPDLEGHLLQSVGLVAGDDSASFVLSDIPRNVKTGDVAVGQLGFANLGTDTWTGGRWRLGYHWTYLDGSPVRNAPVEMTPIPGTIAPNVVTAAQVKFKAPAYPGRYFLVWDMESPDGAWTAENVGDKLHPGACLPLLVSVTAGGNSDARQIDLNKQFNTTATGFEGSSDGDLDGSGDTIPGEQLPPDGTADTVTNPVLTTIDDDPLYPSGYYAGPNGGDHNVSFYYPSQKDGRDALACHGQRIGLPNGYTSVHILAASTADSPSTAAFATDTGGSQTLTIAPWSQTPTGAAIGLSFPYRLSTGAVDATEPCILGDYRVSTPSGAHWITLPNDPDVKVFAITVVR
jgi:hypothetical protein